MSFSKRGALKNENKWESRGPESRGSNLQATFPLYGQRQKGKALGRSNKNLEIRTESRAGRIAHFHKTAFNVPTGKSEKRSGDEVQNRTGEQGKESQESGTERGYGAVQCAERQVNSSPDGSAPARKRIVATNKKPGQNR